jgi:adenylate cyclase
VVAATKATEIAALEARRNELQVRSEGALLGERRAAIGRLVMIGMFGLVSVARPGPHNLWQTFAGFWFALYAVSVLIGTHRLRRAAPGRSRWVPVVLTVLDFTGTTTLALLDVWFSGSFYAGQHAISTAVLMSFSVARISLWHVAFSLACAEISFVVISTYAGALGDRTTSFIMGGYAVLGVLLALTNRAVGEMFKGLRMRDNLTRFLPRPVAERVIADGPQALAPIECDVTVLFSDIRGFTAMSERMAPRDVLAMLDDYFGRMSIVVKGHDGVVGKFLGDGLLAFWGTPERVPDHAVRAVRAARDMRRVVVELNADRAREGLPPIAIGIGVHTGKVAAGMLGGSLQSEYTIIGDAVNVASRIEGLTKEHHVDVLLSETTCAALDGGTREVARAQIRGRAEPVVLYTLDDAIRSPVTHGERTGASVEDQA